MTFSKLRSLWLKIQKTLHKRFTGIVKACRQQQPTSVKYHMFSFLQCPNSQPWLFKTRWQPKLEVSNSMRRFRLLESWFSFSCWLQLWWSFLREESRTRSWFWQGLHKSWSKQNQMTKRDKFCKKWSWTRTSKTFRSSMCITSKVKASRRSVRNKPKENNQIEWSKFKMNTMMETRFSEIIV